VKSPAPSLLTRLVVGQVLVVILFSVLTAVNLFWDFYRAGVGEVDKNISSTVRSTLQFIQSKPASTADMQTKLDLIDESINMVVGQRDENGGYVKAEGSIIMRVFDASMREIYRSSQHRAVNLPQPSTGFADITIDGTQWRSFTASNQAGTLTMQLMQTHQAVQNELLVILHKYILLPLLYFLPFVVLVTWWSLRSGLSRLRALAASIGQRHPDDLRPLSGAAYYAEAAPLVRAINTLLGKLDETLSRERIFLADAAHELRTPLAVIQAQAHVLEHAQSKEAAAAASEELHAGVERAASLIQKLLLTARVSMEDFSPRFEAVDLSAFAQERIASMSILAQKKNIDIELQAPAHCTARIDRETFRSAFDNVLDNAIRYTPPGGEVRVIVAPPEGKHIRVEVSDSGIGIAPELRPRVFERFFRVAGTDQQGSGLGLAIVKRVLALHGSDVTLSSGLDHSGLTVAFTLPTA
jgi:signal transduction histidine kinase